MSENTMKKQALLIGINQYQMLPELKFARQDAEAVRESLEQNYCFTDSEIVLLTDDRPGIFKPSNKRIIQKQLKELAGQELNLFIFGFWGHGLYRNGKRYLCPLDVMSDEVEEMGLPFDELQEALSKIRAKNTCLILDCCQTIHDRGEAESMTDNEQAILTNLARDIGLKRKEVTPTFVSNVAILNSCTKGQSAYEWDDKKHGIFTAHLLDAMSRRFDSVGKIVTYLEDNVTKTALELHKTQTPFCKQEGAILLPANTETEAIVEGDVFISYRHANADLVKPIEEELKRQGISYFIDHVGVNYGMDYGQAITQAVKACKIMLLVWTDDVKYSNDIVSEIALARRLNKTIVPYKIGTFDATQHAALFYQLSTISYYEVERQTDATIKEIVRQLQQALSGNRSTPVFTTPIETPKEQPKPTPVKSQQSNQTSVLATILEEEKRKKQERINQLSYEAGKCYQNGQYQEVIEKLNALLQLRPNDEDTLLLMKLAQQKENVERKQREETKRKRKEEEIRNRKAGTRGTKIVNGVEFAFRWCPAGTFMMGSPDNEAGRVDDDAQHQVTLTKGFWMMETQVTQKQWKAIMGRNPSLFRGDNLPVEQVSWDDCQAFCKQCTELGFPICLPTEVQWEYACRAGTTGPYAGNLDEMAWYIDNSDNQTHPVGTKKANAWGLYDMHGNVWEWCADWYNWDEDSPNGNLEDSIVPSDGTYRVIRGGGSFNGAHSCRSAYRGCNTQEDHTYGLGVRGVLNGQ